MTERSINQKNEKSQTVSKQDTMQEYQTCEATETLSQNVQELGWIEKGTGKHQSNTVYSDCGVSPCVNAVNYKEPTKIVEVKECKND